jgi:four helix bundle protein
LEYSACKRGKKKEDLMVMNYAEWLAIVPSEITNDPIWKLEVYRLALFAGDIGWNDVVALSKNNLMWSVADQLHRSLGSISANLTEGYSRSKGLDRARFMEISLGSARECRDWYYKSRHVLPAEVVKHRMGLIMKIISLLVPMISHQRKNAIREEPAEYSTSTISPDSPIPMP